MILQTLRSCTLPVVVFTRPITVGSQASSPEILLQQGPVSLASRWVVCLLLAHADELTPSLVPPLSGRSRAPGPLCSPRGHGRGGWAGLALPASSSGMTRGARGVAGPTARQHACPSPLPHGCGPVPRGRAGMTPWKVFLSGPPQFSLRGHESGKVGSSQEGQGSKCVKTSF